MRNKHAKFQNDRYKTVSSQEVRIILILSMKNDYIHNVEKVTKINLTIVSKPHAHSHTMKNTQAKF